MYDKIAKNLINEKDYNLKTIFSSKFDTTILKWMATMC